MTWNNTRPIVTVLTPPTLNLSIGILPKIGTSFSDSAFLCTSVARHAKEAVAFLGNFLSRKKSLESIDACLDMVKTAIETAGAKIGEDLFLSISCNFTFSPNENSYALSSDKSLTPEELITVFKELVDKYPMLRLIENPLPCSESAPLKEALPERIQLAFTNEPGEGSLIDIDELKSLSEAVEIARQSANVIVVDRFEITNDTSCADLCAAFEGSFFKVNDPLNGSGLALSRLIRIETQLQSLITKEEDVDPATTASSVEPEILP